MKIVYQGDFRCKAIDGDSSKELITDAPAEFSGKGQAHSPTDLLALSLGSCMLTVMAMKAQREGFNIKGTEVEVIKEMVDKPVRRISKITLNFAMSAAVPEDKRKLLENVVFRCPVHNSLHPDLHIILDFKYTE